MEIGYVRNAGIGIVRVIEMRLKFYDNERVEFKEAFEKSLSYNELEMVFKKLCRHFKISPSLYYGRGSHANKWSIQIANRWGLNFGVLCHELAHVYTWKKYGCRVGHGKKMWNVMRRIINYCKKKNYWSEELDKRTEIKIKPEPTKEEVQLKKIDKKKADLIRYEKRLDYFTRLYSNKIKKAKRSLMMLERYQQSNRSLIEVLQ